MATLTITTTAAQASRISVAYGAVNGLGRDATAAEVKQFVIEEIKRVVIGYEKNVASEAAESAVPDITPTQGWGDK